MANALGDSTARYRGRVTLDPLAHLDPIGTLMILFHRGRRSRHWVGPAGAGGAREFPQKPGAGFWRLLLHLARLSNLLQAVAAAMLLHAARTLLPVMPITLVTVSQVLIVLAGATALAAGGGLFYLWYRQRAAAGPSALGDFQWRVVESTPGTRWWKDEETLKQIVRAGMLGVLVFSFLAAPLSLLISAVYVNCALALFNLIPLGPLDRQRHLAWAFAGE